MAHSQLENIQRIWYKYNKIITVSIIIGILCALLSNSLKKLTEYYEEVMLHNVNKHYIYIFIFPIVGLSLIYFLRQYLFKKKENKGITEIFDTLDTKHNELPVYKIPSHFINGLITVVFGGSTGIEVSTVVASATVGSVAQKKDIKFRLVKRELISAAIAAGVTALFNSPIAGLLFSFEVIYKKINPFAVIVNIVAVLSSWLLCLALSEPPLLNISITHWNYFAIPYFIILGVLAGLNSVYLTKSVIIIKQKFKSFKKHSTKIILGSSLISMLLIVFPQLYGQGYHSLKELFEHYHHDQVSISFVLTLLGVMLLKPIATSLTLASGGDGGVFGPSLFIGAFLGLFTSLVLNNFFGQNVLPVNFMVIGMAAVLSASIHAPFTSLFLVCGLVNNYTLFIPILIACFFAKITSKLILPYNVYTYKPSVNNK